MIGKKVCFFQSLNSTNTFMKENISEFRNGDLICAKSQTGGRGRRSNTWVSTEGNLHTSFLIDNTDQKLSSFDLILYVSNAMCDVLSKYGIKAHIKYPNDIVVGNKKICGILIERVLGDKDLYVVGMGVNIVTEDFGELEEFATSIYLLLKQKYDYRDVLMDFIKSFNAIIETNLYMVYKDYLKRNIVLGKIVVLENKEYLVKSINEKGELVLNRDGKIYVKQMNEVTLKEFYHE